MALVTETWLGTDVDNIVLGDLIPDGYDFYHVPRIQQRGGGVALIYNKSLSLSTMKSDTIFTNFEHLECTINKIHKPQICGFASFTAHRHQNTTT